MNEDEKILFNSVMDVLARFAMLFADGEIASDEEEDKEAGYKVSIGFSGVGAGRIDILISRALAVELAANVLGVDVEEVDEDTVQDAVKEFANILVGEFAAERYGEDQMVNLGIPSIEPASVTNQPVHSDEVSQKIGLCVDDHVLSASLFLEPEPAAG